MKRFFLISLLLLICLNLQVFAATETNIPSTIKVKLNDGSIEEIALDSYLYSVVQSEMGLYYKASDMKSAERVPLEALKAQAVASRSYAVYNMQHASDDAEYHVTSNTSSQVYKTNIDIDPLVKQAVDETTGQVILYEDEVACAYFFATSGGHTESSENVWYAALPYLRGVEDKYEIEVDNHTNWTARYTVLEIEDLFSDLGSLEGVTILERSENDRVLELKFVGSKSSKILLKNGIRTTLGASKVRSQWFDVKLDNEEVIFTGKGFGHGIGMSQNGAIGMALEDYTYDEILEHYYTDITISGFEKTTSKVDIEENENHEEIENKSEAEDASSDELENEEEISEKIDEPKPMLEKLTAFCTTNWMLKIL